MRTMHITKVDLLTLTEEYTFKHYNANADYVNDINKLQLTIQPNEIINIKVCNDKGQVLFRECLEE